MADYVQRFMQDQGPLGPHPKHYTGGWLEVICGSMFSGKTEELIRRVKRAQIARQKVQVFKPRIDTRYAAGQLASHNGVLHQAVAVESSLEIAEMVEPDTTVVAIDEAQFFDRGLTGLCRELARRGVRVIVAGLDLDFRGEPFGPMPVLMAEAEMVDKLQAICVQCGAPASRTQRLINGQPANYNDPVIMVGAKENYEARCRHCHEVPTNSAPSTSQVAAPPVSQAKVDEVEKGNGKGREPVSELRVVDNGTVVPKLARL